MTGTLNLATDPWIDALDTDRRPVTLSLRDALTRARSVATLTGEPPVAAAVTRLLVAVLRDLHGVRAISDDAWRTTWHGDIDPALVGEYLERHHDHFHLHGLHGMDPFMQDPRLGSDEKRGGGWKSPGEIRPDIATGNNPRLYDHHTDLGGVNPYTMTPAAAANWLIAAHAYIRPGIFPGLDSPRVSGRGGTLLSRLVLIPTGPTLHHTLLLSLPTAERDPRDLPPWRRDGEPVVAAPVRGPVSLLTWTSRHILLAAPTDGKIRAVKIAASNEPDPLIPRDQQAALDPHLIFHAVEKAPDGWAITNYDPARQLWRDAAMIAAYSGTASALVRARDIRDVPVNIEAIGVAVESTAKVVDWSRTSVPLPRNPDAFPYAEQAALMADRVALALRKACTTYLGSTGGLSPNASVPARTAALAQATAPFWSGLLRPAEGLPTLLDDAPDDAARTALLEGWGERLLNAAVGALKNLNAPHGAAPRAATAYASALRTLNFHLKEEQPA